MATWCLVAGWAQTTTYVYNTLQLHVYKSVAFMTGLTSHLIFNLDVPDAAHMLREHIHPTLTAAYLALGTGSMITYNLKARMGGTKMSGFEMQI